jgi:phospholipid/cholesterol/gamma-HCH transport system substrate-binding protein
VSRLERLYSPPEIGAPGRRQARARRRDLLLAGLFVLAMLLVGIGAMALLSPTLLGGAYRLYSYFGDAGGLHRGIHVMQDGYVIGTVVAVEPIFPDRDGDAGHCPMESQAERRGLKPCFRTTLLIRKQWPIPEGSTAQLGGAGLLEGDAVKITAGDASDRLADGAVIPSGAREPDLLTQLEALTDTLQLVIDETLTPALDSIETQIHTIGRLLGTDAGDDAGSAAANRERIAGVFADVERIIAGLDRALDADRLDQILERTNQVMANLKKVSGGQDEQRTSIDETLASFDALAKDLRSLIVANKPAIQGSIDETQYLLQELAASLTPILANIETASRNLSALSRELRANPTTVWRGREQPSSPLRQAPASEQQAPSPWLGR